MAHRPHRFFLGPCCPTRSIVNERRKTRKERREQANEDAFNDYLSPPLPPEDYFDPWPMPRPGRAPNARVRRDPPRPGTPSGHKDYLRVNTASPLRPRRKL